MNKENLTTNENEFLKIVYNGAPVSLDKERATELAQKGMNYDKLFEKSLNLRKELDEAKEYKAKIEEIAKELKVPAEEVLKGLTEEKEEVSIAEYSLRNNLPIEQAKSFREMEKRIKLLEKEKKELEPFKKRQEEISELKAAYPDVDERNLDPEILKAWEETKRPLKDIYNEVTLRKLMEEKAAKKANEENLKASSGSVSGIPDREEEYTDEMIRKMSDAEINKNFEKILKQLKKGERE